MVVILGSIGEIGHVLIHDELVSYLILLCASLILLSWSISVGLIFWLLILFYCFFGLTWFLVTNVFFLKLFWIWFWGVFRLVSVVLTLVSLCPLPNVGSPQSLAPPITPTNFHPLIKPSLLKSLSPLGQFI